MAHNEFPTNLSKYSYTQINSLTISVPFTFHFHRTNKKHYSKIVRNSLQSIISTCQYLIQDNKDLVGIKWYRNLNAYYTVIYPIIHNSLSFPIIMRDPMLMLDGLPLKFNPIDIIVASAGKVARSKYLKKYEN